MADTNHKYAIEWNPDCIEWSLDDQLYFTATPYELHRQKGDQHWTFNDRPFYITLNNAVGGSFGGAFPDSEKYIYNQMQNYHEMRISYIEIFKTAQGFGSVVKYYH